jgi:hypothetical protein
VSIDALNCAGLVEIDISVNKLRRLEDVRLQGCQTLLWKDNEFPHEPTLLGTIASQFFGASKVDDDIFTGFNRPLLVSLQVQRTFRTALQKMFRSRLQVNFAATTGHLRYQFEILPTQLLRSMHTHGQLPDLSLVCRAQREVEAARKIARIAGFLWRRRKFKR